MAFRSFFQKGVREANQRAKSDLEIQDAMKKYDGRTFVFNVIGDAIYVFAISIHGITLTVSPPTYPDDMYLEMDFERAKKLVYEGSVSKLDILFREIKWRNISLEDVNFFRKFLGSLRL